MMRSLSLWITAHSRHRSGNRLILFPSQHFRTPLFHSFATAFRAWSCHGPGAGTALATLEANFLEWTTMRVLVVDESPERTVVLRDGLERAGYEVAAALAAPIELLRAVEQVRPDVIIIDTDSPSRDVLEHVVMISRDEPRPIVMFSSDDAPDTIRDAMRAGVSAYVVDGLDAARVKSIVEVAVARFDEYQRLRAELAEANLKLSERKQVERAKGILMKARGMDEDEAFQTLRRMAMDRGKRLGEIAQQLIDMADLLT